MINKFWIKKCSVLLGCLLFTLSSTIAQRKIEKLDRGLVAVQTGSGVYLSWRVFGTDPENVSFNIYRDGTKVNTSPITGATNMVDGAGSTNSVYTVRAILGGVEHGDDGSSTVWDSQVKTLDLSNRPSTNHSPNDINIGDLDGDGQYELVVKWYPNNSKDNSQSGVTLNTYLGAYKLDGTFLWIIDLGRNIRSGAHYTQHLVGDYDQDGYGEVVCKTAPGTRDGTGNYLSDGPAASDNDAADYRNSGGYILSGPEYLTIFNGQTGEEMATINYEVPRGNVSSWGDGYGNRVDRFNSTNAYLDGAHLSMVFQRGYYTRMAIAAYDWDGQTLSHRWTFDSNNSGSGSAYGQGNHSIMAADIDNDGYDELLPGSCAIDQDGSLMWSTGYGHGDANHVGDFDPNSPGLEIWQVSENKGNEPDHYMIRGSDGHILWQHGSGSDNGRAMVGDIDANHYGQEAWSSSVEGTYTADGTWFTNTKPASSNFRIYWDGDLQDELLNSNRIDKWNGNGSDRLLNLTGQSCNGTKATPNISADLLGDWREEVILHDGASRLYIHTTTIPTVHKLYTLMHDPTYRNAISWQQSSYNQPPHLGFFLGDGVENAPKPNITMIGGTDCNGVEGGTAFYDQCGTCVGGNTGVEACYIDCNGDRDGTATLDACGVCSGGNTGVVACIGAIQGEDFCEADGVLESSNSGYIGEGYLNFTNVIGSNATWTIISENTTIATLNIVYANGGTTARPMNVIVNGNNATSFHGNSTGDWATWETSTIQVSLNQGVNVVELVASTADGGPNVDIITFDTEGLQAGSCETDCQGIYGGIAYIDNCNECVDGSTGKEACSQDCAGVWGGDAYQDDCEVCILSNSNQVPCTGLIQGEEACNIDGILLESSNSGFLGQGYANTDNLLGASVSWLIESTSNQQATLSIRYANGGTTARDAKVMVNGIEQTTLDLSSTGDWSTWQDAPLSVSLNVGYNEIVLEATTGDGLANIDAIFLYDDLSNANCSPVLSINNISTGNFKVFPNPAHDVLQLSSSVNWQLFNMNGKLLHAGNETQIDISQLGQGFYILKVAGNYYKFVKN